MAKDAIFDEFEVVGQGKVTVGIEKGIARMVVPSVKREKVIVGQFRDLPRIAAGVEPVGGGREKRVEQGTDGHLIG